MRGSNDRCSKHDWMQPRRELSRNLTCSDVTRSLDAGCCCWCCKPSSPSTTASWLTPFRQHARSAVREPCAASALHPDVDVVEGEKDGGRMKSPAAAAAVNPQLSSTSTMTTTTMMMMKATFDTSVVRSRRFAELITSYVAYSQLRRRQIAGVMSSYMLHNNTDVLRALE